MQIPGTGQVRVTYDCADADGDNVTARLICSSNGGTTFDLLPSTVSGDVSAVMVPGPGKVITWQASVDYPGRYWSQVVAKVIVTDGPSLSGEMVPVSGGSFTMGKNGSPYSAPERTVTLSPFLIDKFEVTNADFKRFMDAGGYTTQAFWSVDGWAWVLANSIASPLGWGEDQYRSGPSWPGFPVVGVSYFEAEAYSAFVGKRLPTEAEWERAARGTDSRDYPWGGSDPSFKANLFASSDPYETGSTPVGFYDGRLHPNPPYQTIDSPSPVGAYDMAGNAYEWVRDWFGSYPTMNETNPQGPVTGTVRVVRGGSYMAGYGSEPSNSLLTWGRLQYVINYPVGGTTGTYPNTRSGVLGFRCAKTAP